jgi:hypothetical protein
MRRTPYVLSMVLLAAVGALAQDSGDTGLVGAEVIDVTWEIEQEYVFEIVENRVACADLKVASMADGDICYQAIFDAESGSCEFNCDHFVMVEIY